MTQMRPTAPERLELVPVEELRAIIAETDRELSALEHRAAAALEAAQRAEAAAREAGVEGYSSAWAMVRLQRFLDALRAEAERDADVMVDLARENARLRVEHVRTEIGRDLARSPELEDLPRSDDDQFWTEPDTQHRSGYFFRRLRGGGFRSTA